MAEYGPVQFDTWPPGSSIIIGMRPGPDSSGDDRRPEVIVDFTSADGLLFVVLRNIGTRSAYKVTTRFSKPFRGLDGRKLISDMRLFRRLEFLPPGKEFSQLVDSLPAYFRRREPTRLTVTITYQDREARRYQDVIAHDLGIYRDLGYLRRSR
jgi:hypothetical protein